MLIVFRKINNHIVQFTFQNRIHNLQKNKEELNAFQNNASTKFLSTLKIGNDIDKNYRLKINTDRKLRKIFDVCSCLFCYKY